MFTLGCFWLNFNNEDSKTTNIQLTTKKNQNHLFSGDWGDLVSDVRSSIKTGEIILRKKKREKTNQEKQIALNGQQVYDISL